MNSFNIKMEKHHCLHNEILSTLVKHQPYYFLHKLVYQYKSSIFCLIKIADKIVYKNWLFLNFQHRFHVHFTVKTLLFFTYHTCNYSLQSPLIVLFLQKIINMLPAIFSCIHMYIDPITIDLYFLSFKLTIL